MHQFLSHLSGLLDRDLLLLLLSLDPDLTDLRLLTGDGDLVLLLLRRLLGLSVVGGGGDGDSRLSLFSSPPLLDVEDPLSTLRRSRSLRRRRSESSRSSSSRQIRSSSCRRLRSTSACLSILTEIKVRAQLSFVGV
jgi:hypothetical protein